MIRLSEVTYAYRGSDEKILNGVSFEIGEGEIFGLLGPSGAGKSTTQSLLTGLLKGFGGSAQVFDKDVGTLGRVFYERIGVCFELPTLYLRLTALENLKLHAALYSVPTLNPMDMLALVGLAEDANKKVEAFSKGMKMRLNLCRALINDPELLFLDEPTTGQDPARARRTRDLIQSLKAQGKTIFLTTHNMTEADEICDRVGFLVGGQTKIIGAPDVLKQQYGMPMLEVTTRQGKHHFQMHGLGEDQEFARLLQSGSIQTMHTQEASLDDVFIKVAGAAA